ncbi:MAG: M28 family peptidase [Candidatus Fermentibacteraceae bacterium]|nr:M28 family peptidase [Candidatus Fermentibacteraceae bacterium]
MYRMILTIALIATAVPAAELTVFEGRLQQDEVQAHIHGMQVVYESTDYFVAFTPDGMTDLSMDRTVLDSGDISPDDFVLVHVSSPRGLDHLDRLGETIFQRGGVAIVKLSGPRPEVFVHDGVFFVQPLRVINTDRSLENPFLSRPLRGVDDDISDIVAAVSEDSIKACIQYLQDYGTRYSSTDSYDTACDWVQYKFESYGLTAVQQTFPMSSYDCQNVIAELPGVTDSTKIWIICGHLDSTSGSAPSVAPGADDNASGSSAVIEAARLLSGYEFNYTIRFICFGGEEQGLWGSDYYAGQASSAGDDIIGVVNLDMVLYAPPGDDILWVPYNTPSHDLALAMEAICDTYVPALTVDIEYSPGTTYSDHASFWSEGYAAVLGIEQEVYSNPYYHQTTDLLANYTQYFPFGTNCIKGAIATIAYLAEPTGGTGMGEGGTQVPDFRVTGMSPNPVNSLLTVSLAREYSAGLEISVFDITGRKVISGSRDASEGTVSLDLSALPPGVYAVRISSGDFAQTRSVVVAR